LSRRKLEIERQRLRDSIDVPPLSSSAAPSRPHRPRQAVCIQLFTPAISSASAALGCLSFHTLLDELVVFRPRHGLLSRLECSAALLRLRRRQQRQLDHQPPPGRAQCPTRPRCPCRWSSTTAEYGEQCLHSVLLSTAYLRARGLTSSPYLLLRIERVPVLCERKTGSTTLDRAFHLGQGVLSLYGTPPQLSQSRNRT
jgi:hypothetical protein